MKDVGTGRVIIMIDISIVDKAVQDLLPRKFFCGLKKKSKVSGWDKFLTQCSLFCPIIAKI